MKMKELEDRTGVNRESIRYYIREGLLPQPQKPKRNVAEYGPLHVERTLLIKRLQDEHFLPLKVVKGVLEKIGNATSLSGLSRPALSQLLPVLIHDTTSQEAVTIADLISSDGLSQQEVEQMVHAGAISIDADGLVPARDAEIARLWGAAREAGFTAQRGYDIEFLKRYVDLAEQWAEFETEQFLDAFAQDPDDQAAEVGATGLDVSGRLVALLRTNSVVRKIAART